MQVIQRKMAAISHSLSINEETETYRSKITRIAQTRTQDQPSYSYQFSPFYTILHIGILAQTTSSIPSGKMPHFFSLYFLRPLLSFYPRPSVYPFKFTQVALDSVTLLVLLILRSCFSFQLTQISVDFLLLESSFHLLHQWTSSMLITCLQHHNLLIYILSQQAQP